MMMQKSRQKAEAHSLENTIRQCETIYTSLLSGDRPFLARLCFRWGARRAPCAARRPARQLGGHRPPLRVQSTLSQGGRGCGGSGISRRGAKALRAAQGDDGGHWFAATMHLRFAATMYHFLMDASWKNAETNTERTEIF
jgi:hypothetical protein